MNKGQGVILQRYKDGKCSDAKIISSNEIMLQALEESKIVNSELVKFLETALSNYQKLKKANKKKIFYSKAKGINKSVVSVSYTHLTLPTKA